MSFIPPQSVTNTRGASLIIALGLVLLLMLLGIGASSAVLNFLQTTHQVERANAAYFTAEAGMEMALYDYSAYTDGYQLNEDNTACTAAVNLAATPTDTAVFSQACNTVHPYKMVNFTDQSFDASVNGGKNSNSTLSGARGFWRLFSRAMQDQVSAQGYVLPNPYFVGNKDGTLTLAEWGHLTKRGSLSIGLTNDTAPRAVDIDSDPTNNSDAAVRFTYLDLSAMNAARIFFVLDPNETPDPSYNSSANPSRAADKEDVLAWTLSAIDGHGTEYTLQGVAWESDFATQDCDGNGTLEYCFIFDLKDAITEVTINTADGHALAGEDINNNIAGSAIETGSALYNRVSGLQEVFHFNTAADFFAQMNSANITGDPNDRWQHARLSVSLIGTLSETTNIASDSLLYRVQAIPNNSWTAALPGGGIAPPLPSDTIFIVSEGFAGPVKQTIETSFRPQSTISIFTYAIFQ